MSIDASKYESVKAKRVAMEESNESVKKYLLLLEEEAKEYDALKKDMISADEGFEGITVKGYVRHDTIVRKDLMSDRLLIALAEYNTDCISLTEKKVKNAITNATGKRKESAKLLQKMNLSMYVEPNPTAVIQKL